MLVLPILDKNPVWGENCYIAPNATIIGDVEIGNDCSVWFNAVIRGDVNAIRIGNKTNIQDGVVIHATFEKASTTIGNQVSIGHNAIVHGCELKDFVLIGMGAIVMDNAIVETECIVAAGAVVLENTICESGYLYAGTPAKKIKPLTAAQIELLHQLPDRYVMYADWLRD